MGLKLNPLTAQFDLVGSGGGGGSAFFAGEVATYADLPLDGTAALNSRWLVRSNSGTWPFSSYKQAGIYIRTATGGTDRDADYTLTDTSFHDVMSDDAFLIFDNTDPTKAAKFDVGANVSAGQTRTLSIPDASGTIARTEDFAAPPAIGSTTSNSGAFTTLSASGTVSGTGFSNYLASPPAIGGTSAAAGSFTTLSASTSLTLGTSGILSGGTNIIEQRNTTSAQTFRIYNTVSGAADANYERLFLRWNANVAQIGTEKGGTGSARALALQTDGITRVTVDTTGQVGIGVAPERPFHVQGSAAFARIDRQGNFGPAILLTRMATGTTVTSSWLFGPTDQVAGVVNDDFAIIDFGAAVSGTGGTQRLTISKSTGQLTVNGNLNLATKDLVTDTTTGTKIGTGTTQKLGFFNATPIVRPAAIADATDAATTQARLNDLLAAMRSLGLIAT